MCNIATKGNVLRCVTKVRGYIQKAESAIKKDRLFWTLQIASNNPFRVGNYIRNATYSESGYKLYTRPWKATRPPDRT